MKQTPQQLQQRFNEFNQANPHVYNKIVQMTRDLKSQGHKKIGMQMIFEVLRWRSMMRTNSKDYKLSNDYAAYYSRLIMQQEPDLDGIYTIRENKADWVQHHQTVYENDKYQQRLEEKVEVEQPKAVSWLHDED